MPTSSTSVKLNGTKISDSSSKTSTVFRAASKNSYWPNKMAATKSKQQARESLSSSIAAYSPPSTSQQSGKLVGANISPPSSLSSTSNALRNSLLSGPGVCLAPDGSTPDQTTSSSTFTKLDNKTRGSSRFAQLAGKSLLVGSETTATASQSSLASSTARLASSTNSVRRLDLRFVKSLIIVLMGVDLVVSLLVHHYAQNDELKLWLTNYRLRFSVINLLLSAVWFTVLAGGVLFNVYGILVASLLINGASFLLLLGLSVVHFSRRLDYNAVQLAKLLALLFSVILLHLYLLLSMALTLHLALAIRRHQRQSKS